MVRQRLMRQYSTRLFQNRIVLPIYRISAELGCNFWSGDQISESICRSKTWQYNTKEQHSGNEQNCGFLTSDQAGNFPRSFLWSHAPTCRENKYMCALFPCSHSAGKLFWPQVTASRSPPAKAKLLFFIIPSSVPLTLFLASLMHRIQACGIVW